MSIVADASVALAWFFEEEQTAQALGILDKIEKEGLLVPSLWWSEIENGILMGERRGRKELAQSEAFLKLIQALPIEADETPRYRLSQDILRIGRQFQLTSYDAAYVELASRESAVLATFDESIRRTAQKLKIQVLPKAIGK